MLAHSPPLPLIIDYEGTSENDDEKALALVQRDRIRRIRLCLPAPRLYGLLRVIDGKYPILEYLIMDTMEDNYQSYDALILPETLQVPQLRHLTLIGFAFPKGSHLLTTTLDLVTLCLQMQFPFHFLPTVLLQWLSSMSQLETLVIGYSREYPISDDGWDEVESQLMHIMPTPTHITLPNLRWFGFLGISAHLEVLVPLITASSLENLHIFFYHQHAFSVPNLLQFMNTRTDLRFSFRRAKFLFSEDAVVARVFPREGAEMHGLSINLDCQYLVGINWQATSVAYIFHSLSQIFSAVEHITLEDLVHCRSSEVYRESDRAEWRRLLGSFSHVKTLHIGHALVRELSRSLRPDDGELPLELLPELQELTVTRSGDCDVGDAFTSFIDAHKDAGRPVTLAHSPDLYAPL